MLYLKYNNRSLGDGKDKTMSIFEYKDYKKAIKEVLLQKKRHFPNTFSFQAMANYMQVQKTYLSKVLNQDGNLTPDQFFLACEFLQITDRESTYLSLLREKEMTTLAKRKSFLEQEIQKLQRQELKTEAYLNANARDAKLANADRSESSSSKNRPPVNQDIKSESANSMRSLYFLDPYVQLVHLGMEVPPHNKTPTLLVDKLGISEERLTKIIKILTDLNFVRWSKDRYVVDLQTMHLPEDSEIFPVYRQMVRQILLSHLEKSTADDYHFSVFFTADKETQIKIRQNFLNFLKETQKLVEKADPKLMVQMNFDLKRWL